MATATWIISNQVPPGVTSTFIFSVTAFFAIEVLVKRMSVRERAELFERLMVLENELTHVCAKVLIAWLPGHSGIYYEMADTRAKSTTHDIYAGRVAASNLVTYVEVVKMSKDIAKNSWQTKWNYELSGSHTRQLILEVGIRLHFPNDRDTGISYCRLLLNDIC